MKLKCMKCNELWNFPDGTDVEKQHCPYCGSAFVVVGERVRIPAGYVFPSGAPHDRPGPLESIGEDTLCRYKEGFVSSQLDCVHCGHSYQVAYRKWIDVTDDAELRQALGDGTYFNFTCPKCGKITPFAFRMWVYDIKKRYFLYLVGDLETALSMHKKHISLTGADVGFPAESLPAVRHRLVRDAHELIEKIRTFEAELDDYAIEGLKAYLTEAQKLTDKVEALHFQEVAEDGRLRFFIKLKDGRHGTIAAPRARYDLVKAGLDVVGKFREGEFRYVNQVTMIGDHCDMNSWFA